MNRLVSKYPPDIDATILLKILKGHWKVDIVLFILVKGSVREKLKGVKAQLELNLELNDINLFSIRCLSTEKIVRTQ